MHKILSDDQSQFQLTRKKTCNLVDFADPVDQRVKLRESEKIDIYLDLARELIKLLRMGVPVIPIVV